MSILLQKPSQLLPQVKIHKCSNWTILKFDHTLQERQTELLEKNEQTVLSEAESAELDAIQELATIFAYVNGQIAHKQRNGLR